MISRSDNHSETGFTLIEMIVVIAILGLMMVLVTVGARSVSPATHARAAAQAIADGLRSARAEALTANRAVEFTIDIARRRYQSGAAPEQMLPNDLTLSLLTSRGELVSGSVAGIRFNPDGSSSGGRVTVNGGGKVWMVGIDWLSGRVSIAAPS
jgi:general secretion pathway protein H